MRAELVDVAPAKLGEAAGLVAKPLSERAARRQLLLPLVELGLLLRDTARPEPIDENAIPVLSRRRFVGALQADVHRRSFGDVAFAEDAAAVDRSSGAWGA